MARILADQHRRLRANLPGDLRRHVRPRSRQPVMSQADYRGGGPRRKRGQSSGPAAAARMPGRRSDGGHIAQRARGLAALHDADLSRDPYTRVKRKLRLEHKTGEGLLLGGGRPFSTDVVLQGSVADLPQIDVDYPSGFRSCVWLFGGTPAVRISGRMATRSSLRLLKILRPEMALRLMATLRPHFASRCTRCSLQQ